MARFLTLILAACLLLIFADNAANAQVTFSVQNNQAIVWSTGRVQINLQIVNLSYAKINKFQFILSMVNALGSKVLVEDWNPGGRDLLGHHGESIHYYTAMSTLDSNALGWNKLNKFWIDTANGFLPLNATAYTVMEVYADFPLPSNLHQGDIVTVIIGNLTCTLGDGQTVAPTSSTIVLNIPFNTTLSAVEDKVAALLPTTLEQLRAWQQQHPETQIRLYNFLGQAQDINRLTESFYLYTIEDAGQTVNGKIICLH